jgi:hypothetical protein
MNRPEDSELLARIDERTKAMSDRMDDFVTRAEFAPVRSIAFGMVAAILLAVLGVLLAMAGLGK